MQTVTANGEQHANIKSEDVPLVHRVIRDIASDYYGRRMAVCSSDSNIFIWDHGDIAQKWDAVQFRPKSGPASRVCWAPPEFGSLLACGFEKCVSIWEEVNASSGTLCGADGLPKSQSNEYSTSEQLAKFSAISENNQQSASMSERDIQQRHTSMSHETRRPTFPNRQRGSRSVGSETADRSSENAQVATRASKNVSVAGNTKERSTDTSHRQATNSQTDVLNSAESPSVRQNAHTSWTLRFLANSNASVTDCEFAPRAAGKLHLATSSADGKLRMYDSDTTAQLEWKQVCELDSGIGPLSSLSWCPARLLSPLIACASNDDRNSSASQPSEHVAMFECSVGECGRLHKWKRVVLINMDAIRRRSRERVNLKTDAQTQTHGRAAMVRVDMQPRSRLNTSRTEPVLTRVECASGESAAPRRSDTRSCLHEPRSRNSSQLEDNAPVSCPPVHDMAFAPNFGRASQLLALATSNGVRVLRLEALCGANFDSHSTFRPLGLLTDADNAESSAKGLPSNEENAQTRLASRLRAALSSTGGGSKLSRSVSTASTAGSSITQSDADCNVQQDAARVSTNAQNPNFGFIFCTTEETSRYACECVMHDVSDMHVWRVAWNSLGSQLAASRDNGRVAIYMNDVGAQRWTLTQLIEVQVASLCRAPLDVTNDCNPLLSSLHDALTLKHSTTQTVRASQTHSAQQKLSFAEGVTDASHSRANGSEAPAVASTIHETVQDDTDGSQSKSTNTEIYY